MEILKITPFIYGNLIVYKDTSDYHISLTVSNNIFSFWLLLTVVNQIGLPGLTLHGPWALGQWTRPGPLDQPWSIVWSKSVDDGPWLQGCQGVFWNGPGPLLWIDQGYFSVSCQIRCVIYHHD